MTSPLILVTGATGKTGAAVIEQLLAQDASVRALVRRHDARSARLAALGAEVVTADAFDPQQVTAALAGVRRLYYLPPWNPYMVQSAVVFATAAHRAGVESVVHLSQWLANPAHPSLLTRQLWLTEQLFDLLPDAAHTTVNPGFFADNYLGNGLIGLAAALGVLPIPLGQGRNAPPAMRTSPASLLPSCSTPPRTRGAGHRPTGPRLLTPSEMADIMGDAVGRRVRYRDVPEQVFMKVLRVLGPRAGIDTVQLAEIRWYYQESKLGTWELDAPTTHVRGVTGADPEAFETIARRYAERPEAQRTPVNLARALWDFARIGLTPAPRLDRLVRSQHQPVPPAPELSARSELWAAEHLSTTRQIALTT